MSADAPRRRRAAPGRRRVRDRQRQGRRRQVGARRCCSPPRWRARGRRVLLFDGCAEPGQPPRAARRAPGRAARPRCSPARSSPSELLVPIGRAAVAAARRLGRRVALRPGRRSTARGSTTGSARSTTSFDAVVVDSGPGIESVVRATIARDAAGGGGGAGAGVALATPTRSIKIVAPSGAELADRRAGQPRRATTTRARPRSSGSQLAAERFLAASSAVSARCPRTPTLARARARARAALLGRSRSDAVAAIAGRVLDAARRRRAPTRGGAMTPSAR